MIQKRAVMAWALGSLFFFYAFGLRVSPSVMVDELMREFGVTALVLGNLSAFYFYAYASIQIPVGVMMDRSGPRLLMCLAALTTALGCVVFATSSGITGAYVGRMMIGLGCGFSWVGVLTIIGSLLPARNFAAFTGGGQFAGTAGAIMGQAPLGYLVQSSGWRSAMLMVGAAGVVLAVLLWLVVPSRAHGTTKQQPLRDGLRSAASRRVTWILSAVGMSLTGPVLAFAGLWGVPWLVTSYELDRSSAAQLMSVVFFGWLVGAPTIGWLSDRIKKRKPLLILGTALSATATASVIYIPDLPRITIMLLLFLLGIGGSSMILTFAMAREQNDLSASGAALGIVNTFVVASGALFQPLIGWLLDLNWSDTLVDGVRLYSKSAYDLALMVLPLFAATGFILTLTLREKPRTDD